MRGRMPFVLLFFVTRSFYLLAPLNFETLCHTFMCCFTSFVYQTTEDYTGSGVSEEG